MRAKRWMVAGMMVGLAWSAALQAASPQAGSWRQLQSTVRKAGSAPPETAPREAWLAALAQTAAQGPASQTGWKAQDYEALYALLQKYRNELRAMGIKEKNLETLLEDLQKRQDEINAKLENTHPLRGLKIHGRLLSEFDDLQQHGPGAPGGNTTRWRQGVQRAELELTYDHGVLHGLAQLDSMYVAGNQYSGTNARIGVRRIFVALETPLSVKVGDFGFVLSPLTLWRNEDPRPYESSIFEKRRQRQRELFFLDESPSWHLRGAQAAWTAPSLGPLSLRLSALGVPMGTAGNVYTTTASGVDLISVYNSYLTAWASDFRFENLAAVSYQGTLFTDSTQSAQAAIASHPDPSMVGRPVPGFHNEVHSLRLKAGSGQGWFELDAEAAISLFSGPAIEAHYFDPEFGAFGYQKDSALRARAALRWQWLELKGAFHQAGDGFVSPAAQGRSSEPGFRPLGPFETENTLFDPASNSFSGLNVPMGPESRLNPVLLPPVLWHASAAGLKAGRFLAPYHPAENSLRPYGDATPNRQGYSGSARITVLEGLFAFHGLYQAAREIKAAAGRPVIAMTGLGAGLESDLSKITGLNLKLGGGWTQDHLGDGAWVAFSSARLDAGLELGLWKGAALLGGWRHLDFNGTLPYTAALPFEVPDGSLAVIGKRSFDQIFDETAFSLEQSFGPHVLLTLLYSMRWFQNPYGTIAAAAADQAEGYQADQGYARLEFRF